MASAGKMTLTVQVLTAERLAAALQRIGPGDIEEMAFTKLTIPAQYIGDEAENVIADDPYPMASLAAAIMRELGR